MLACLLACLLAGARAPFGADLCVWVANSRYATPALDLLRHPQEPPEVLRDTRNARFCNHKQHHLCSATACAPRARAGSLGANPYCTAPARFSPGTHSSLDCSLPRCRHLPCNATKIRKPLLPLSVSLSLALLSGAPFFLSSPSVCPTHPAFCCTPPLLRHPHAHADHGHGLQDLAQELQRETHIPTDTQHIVSVVDGKRLDKIDAHTRLQDLHLQNGDQLQVWQYGPAVFPAPYIHCVLELNPPYILLPCPLHIPYWTSYAVSECPLCLLPSPHAPAHSHAD